MLRNKDLTADPFVFIKLLLDDKIHFRVPLGTRFTMENFEDFACVWYCQQQNFSVPVKDFVALVNQYL